MPLNPFAIVDAFSTESLPDKQAKQASNALAQIKTVEGINDLKNKNALAAIAKGNPDLGQVAEQYQQQTGDVMGAQTLRSNANTNSLNAINYRLAGIKYIQQSARGVTEQNYPAWRQSMIQFGLGDSQSLPEQYDKTVIDRLANINPGALKSIILHTGTGKAQQIVQDKQGNTVYSSPEYDPRPTKPAVSYGKPYKDENGNLVQRGDNGRIVPAGSTSGSRKTGAAGLIDTLVEHGIDEDRAIEIATSAKTNPAQTAAGLAREEFKAQQAVRGEKDYQTLDALYEKWRAVLSSTKKLGGDEERPDPGNADKPAGMTRTKFGKVSVVGTGSRNDPLQPTTDDEFRAIPSGKVYVDPDDGKLYVKQ